MKRGDPGKNELDEACKDHDIAYTTCPDSKSRRKADKKLISQAFRRIYAKDAKLDERAVALLVSALMSAKIGLTKIGLGLNDRKSYRKMNRKRKRSKRKSISFNKLVQGARESIKKSKLNSLSIDETIQAAIRSAKETKRGKIIKKLPRVLKVPKFGGNIYSILPILSGLSAIGSITASTVSVVKAIRDIEKAKKHLKNNTSGDQQNNDGKKIGRSLNLIYMDGKNAKGAGFYLKSYESHH